jgi:hypothetical protein
LDEYHQRGGLRWGKSLWRGSSNATWPFATLRATAQALSIAVGLGPLKRRFTFSRAEVDSVCLTRGLFSAGLQVQHSRPDYPPFILFWTFAPGRLSTALAKLGYSVGGTERNG